MKIWSGDSKKQLERMGMNVDCDNGKAVGIVNGRDCKLQRFSINEFWKDLGCLVSGPTSSIGGLMLNLHSYPRSVWDITSRVCSL